MTREQLAKKLNGRKLGQEITPAEVESAKRSGLVVAFGTLRERDKAPFLILAGAATRHKRPTNIANACLWIGAKGALAGEPKAKKCPTCGHVEVEKATAVLAKLMPRDGWLWEVSVSGPHAAFRTGDRETGLCLGVVFELPKT